MKLFFTGIICILFSHLFFVASAKDPDVIHRQIKWQSPIDIEVNNQQKIKALSFESAAVREDLTPYFSENIELSGNVNSVRVEIVNAVYEPLVELNLLSNKNSLLTEITVTSGVSYRKKKPYAFVSFIPFRKNPVTGIAERLLSFDLKITPTGYSSSRINARHYQIK